MIKPQNMRTFRWIMFLPVAAVSAVAFGYLWTRVSPKAYIASISKVNFPVFIGGVAPLLLSRLFPVVIFILVGAAIAPKQGRVQIALLGFLGGIFGFPLEPKNYTFPGGYKFYLTEGLGVLLGVMIGMLIAFILWPKRNESIGKQAKGVMAEWH